MLVRSAGGGVQGDLIEPAGLASVHSLPTSCLEWEGLHGSLSKRKQNQPKISVAFEHWAMHTLYFSRSVVGGLLRPLSIWSICHVKAIISFLFSRCRVPVCRLCFPN
jgi:hypothetical protein